MPNPPVVKKKTQCSLPEKCTLQFISSLLNTYFAPITVLGTGNSKMNNPGFLLSRTDMLNGTIERNDMGSWY